jgi:hypothetical protein
MKSAQRGRSVNGYLLRSELKFVFRLWLFYVAGVAVFAATAIAVFGASTGSVWERALQAPLWFAFAWGIYQTAVYLPLFIAHGHTRRAFASHCVRLTSVYAAALAALITAGFALEWAVFRVLGWPQIFEDRYLLFGAPTDLGSIFVHFWLVLLMWITTGALIGAAFYRFRLLGLLFVPVALALLGLVESVAGSARLILRFARSFGVQVAPLTRIGEEAMLAWPAAATLYVLLLAAGLALTWLLIRDVPMRAQPA